MRVRTAVILATATAVVSVGLTACSSSSSTSPASSTPPVSTGTTASSATPPSSTAAQGQSPLHRWKKACAYLKAQSKPTEIVCNWLTASGGTPTAVPRPAVFYSFSDRAAWKDHLITRNDPLPKGTFEECAATVPTTVPYGPAIDSFLRRFGLTFVADSNGTPGLTPIEIAYAGQDANDPDMIYHDEPGLFGLKMALAQLGRTPFEPGTSKIIQPAEGKTAARYWKYALPLLRWYGYKP